MQRASHVLHHALPCESHGTDLPATRELCGSQAGVSVMQPRPSISSGEPRSHASSQKRVNPVVVRRYKRQAKPNGVGETSWPGQSRPMLMKKGDDRRGSISSSGGVPHPNPRLNGFQRAKVKAEMLMLGVPAIQEPEDCHRLADVPPYSRCAIVWRGPEQFNARRGHQEMDSRIGCDWVMYVHKRRKLGNSTNLRIST